MPKLFLFYFFFLCGDLSGGIDFFFSSFCAYFAASYRLAMTRKGEPRVLFYPGTRQVTNPPTLNLGLIQAPSLSETDLW